ncbi:MAG: exonuclease SbcCD subunit D [Myxococcota bacterium]
MDFQFIHAADIHLDSPLQGLERYDDAPVAEVRVAPRKAFENLVQLAIEEEVAFVLLAGDLYDGDWKDYRTGIFFVSQMKKLEAAGISVHLVSGNHDAVSQITKKLSLPENVTHYSSRKPQTVLISELGVAIHGQSFAGRSVTEDLSAGYPDGEPGRLDIGLLHTSLDGREGHAPYAPCSAEGLKTKGYDYWALGHVHRREIVSEDPWIVFPGNLQGRHARETGGKGCSLIRVEDGTIVDVTHRDLDVVRWAQVQVDLSGIARVEDSLDAVSEALENAIDSAEGRMVAARLVLEGATPVHDDLLRESGRFIHEYRSLASELGAAGVWLEKIVFKTRRARDLATELAREDALGDLLRSVASLEATDDEIAALGGAFADLKKKLPAALAGGDEPIDPVDPAYLRAALPGARDLALARLLDAEEGA